MPPTTTGISPGSKSAIQGVAVARTTPISTYGNFNVSRRVLAVHVRVTYLLAIAALEVAWLGALTGDVTVISAVAALNLTLWRLVALTGDVTVPIAVVAFDSF